MAYGLKLGNYVVSDEKPPTILQVISAEPHGGSVTYNLPQYVNESTTPVYLMGAGYDWSISGKTLTVTFNKTGYVSTGLAYVVWVLKK